MGLFHHPFVDPAIDADVVVSHVEGPPCIMSVFCFPTMITVWYNMYEKHQPIMHQINHHKCQSNTCMFFLAHAWNHACSARSLFKSLLGLDKAGAFNPLHPTVSKTSTSYDVILCWFCPMVDFMCRVTSRSQRQMPLNAKTGLRIKSQTISESFPVLTRSADQGRTLLNTNNAVIRTYKGKILLT